MKQLEEFQHQSVLLSETVRNLVRCPGGVYLDCTAGGGGHAAALLAAAGPSARLLALDQDPAALNASAERLSVYADRVQLIRCNFAKLDRVLQEYFQGRSQNVLDGVLFDLGVSSPQLDMEERGFSYWGDAPLDMRMDPERDETAASLLARCSERELTRILHEYGEERWAARIASFIVRERAERQIISNKQLVELIKQAIPVSARREGGHPARRTFQALRIAVNDELNVLESALHKAIAALKASGRIAVISFHSLEDRVVKQAFLKAEHPCQCPPRYPCVCGLKPYLRVLARKPIVPTDEEIRHNPRARSAKLRVAERLVVAEPGAERRY